MIQYFKICDIACGGSEMIRIMMILTCVLFAIPAFSYDEAAKGEFFLSAPEQVATLSSESVNCPESMIPKVSQGTLSNGMRFYSCPFYKLPENEVTFSIVLRKTDQANSLPRLISSKKQWDTKKRLHRALTT